MLLGLNLLRLLSQNRIAEFHTELELIEVNQLHESVYIKHPVEIEQWLMEGSYNKVVSNRQSVPADEFLFFINILISTIRFVFFKNIFYLHSYFYLTFILFLEMRLQIVVRRLMIPFLLQVQLN